MECAIRTIRKINFNMGAIKVEDTKRIRFSNMAKFMFSVMMLCPVSAGRDSLRLLEEVIEIVFG